MHQLKWLIISAVFAIDVSNAQILQPGVNPLAAGGLSFGRRDLRDAAVRIDDVTAQELERQTEQEIIASSHWLANAQTLSLRHLNLSTDCGLQFSEYAEALDPKFRAPIWALKMADATGKPESGLLDGNGFYEGRAPLCRRANERLADEDIVMTPHYCAAWHVLLASGAVLELEPLEPLNATRTDWWKFITRGLGVCIPDTCDETDAEILIRNVYNFTVPEVRDMWVVCHSREPEPLDTEAIITIVILSLFGALTLAASLYDAYKPRDHDDNEVASDDVTDSVAYKMTAMSSQPPAYHVNMAYTTSEPESSDVSKPRESKDQDASDVNINNNNAGDAQREKPDISKINDISDKANGQVSVDVTDASASKHKSETMNFKKEPGMAEQLLACFSLYQNVPVIVSARQSRDAIGCINGIRFIAMCCVLLGHSYGNAPYENMDYAYRDMYGNVINAKMMSMDLYVDTFFILSAFLMSMSFLRQLKRHKGLTLGRLGLHYFNRYWRLTPTYAIVLMIYTNLFHYFTRGITPEYIPDVDSCSTEWWKNLLYINNLTGLSCFALSWYLAVDMQLFIIAPLFLYLLYRWEKLGIVANVLGFTGGVIANIVLNNQYYGYTMEGDWFDLVYFMTWTRCPVYFMGIMLGYFFVKMDGKFEIQWYVAVIGWLVAGFLYVMLTYLPGLDGCMQGTGLLFDCHWSQAGKVVWATLYRPLWGVWVCWLICACHAGWGGVLNTFLSWNFFIPLGRLTYLNYLTHGLFIAAFIYNTPVQFYATDYFAVRYGSYGAIETYMFFALLLVTHLMSLVLCSVVSAPLTRLAIVFLPTARKEIR